MTGIAFRELSPVSFLERAAAVFAERPAVVDGDRRDTCAQLRGRAQRLAGLLASRGVDPMIDSECYDDLVDAAEPHRVEVTDERSLLSINYTSGVAPRASCTTTGAPPGRPWRWLATPSSTPRPSTCGPCRCSTPTAGASRGP